MRSNSDDVDEQVENNSADYQNSFLNKGSLYILIILYRSVD